MAPSTSSLAPKTPLKRREFLVKELINPQGGSVAPVKEVDDHHIKLLAVPVAPANPLLDALRVPGQVIVNDEVAELQVDPLRCRFGGDHDGGFVAEVFDKGRPLVGCGRVRDVIRTSVALQPTLINLF